MSEHAVKISDRITLYPTTGRLRVAFSAAEDWQLRQVNLWRQATHEGKPDPKMARGRNGVDVSLQGVRAEYAVARVLGVPFDLASNLDRDLKAADLYLDDGVSLQVKARSHVGRPLLFKEPEYPFRSDYAVLCYSDTACEQPVLIAGYVSRQEFWDRCEDITEAIGPQPGLQPERLHPLLDLRRHISACPSCGQRRPPTSPLEAAHDRA